MNSKKNRKPLFTLISFFIIFIIFIYIITRPSSHTIAIENLKNCENIEDVKKLWDNYKKDLNSDIEFHYAMRKKLSEYSLSDQDIQECKIWLPKTPTSFNIIVVPDLSNRIINIPDQIKNDKIILNTIWKTFEKLTRRKRDSKDKLVVDVTDIDQAKGQFDLIANRLSFDLSLHTSKSNRLYFTPEKFNQFSRCIDSLYNFAKPNPIGADYRFYLRRHIQKHLKKSTLFDNYINKVIFITDGYLEPQNDPPYTKIYGYQKPLYSAVSDGDILKVINARNLNIPTVNIDLSETHLLVCEVNERKSGKGYDFEILKTYWEDWFRRMNVSKNITFLQKQQASIITEQKVEQFITELE